jgi:RimJ/RimL family protein N-acetyltransferase
MIRGENITLRVVQEKDLETLFRYSSDIDNRGEFFPCGYRRRPRSNMTFTNTGFGASIGGAWSLWIKPT